MTSLIASVSLQEGVAGRLGDGKSMMLAGTGRKSAFMLRTMCIIFDKGYCSTWYAYLFNPHWYGVPGIYTRMRPVAKKRYQAVGFPCNRMFKLSSSRGIRIDAPVLSVSWSFEDHSCLLYTSDAADE